MNAIESPLHLLQHENACVEPSWPPALGVTAGQFSKHLECMLGHGIPTNQRELPSPIVVRFLMSFGVGVWMRQAKCMIY